MMQKQCCNSSFKIKSNATCNITITGYPAASKASQAFVQKRVEQLKNTLLKKKV